METLTGTIEPIGMSIFMQGSHQLLNDEGEVLVLLQAGDGVDLNKFSGKKATVTGRVEGTVEAGGTIMTVSKVENASK